MGYPFILKNLLNIFLLRAYILHLQKGKKKLDETIDKDAESIDMPASTTTEESNSSVPLTQATSEEMELPFKNQSVGGTKPAILSLIPPYSDNYVPKSLVQKFPEPLISLYASYYVDLEYHELLNACETISLHVTEKMTKSVEKATKSQSKSILWFKHQPGQVTASHMRLSVVQILQIPRKV